MLLSQEILSKVIQELKSQNKKIVFTNGCFDIIHSGHIYYLEQARNCGDFLVVGLNSDDSVRRLKGENRPINTQSDRATVLSGLKSVDFVTYFDEDTPLELIKLLSPNVLVKGADYDIKNIVGADFVLKNAGEVKTIRFIEGKSSTNIINKFS